MTYSVRPMSKEDVARVNEIDREAFPSQWPPPNYRHELQNQIAHYIVACDDTRIDEEPEVKPQDTSGLASRIGRFFRCNHSPDPEPPPDKRYIVGFAGIWMMADEAHITNIAVRQPYQRRGIGELLIISTIDLASGLKASNMTLEVRASNLAAQSLYHKYRFNEVGVRRGYYLDNREDGIIMTTDSIASAAFQAHLRQLREALARKMGRPAQCPGE